MNTLLRMAVGLSLAIAGQADKEAVPEQQQQMFEFGKAGLDQEVEHTFTFRNTSAEPLEIRNTEMTPSLTVTRMSGVVPPGGTGSVTVRLDKPRRQGEFQGFVQVNFKGDIAESLQFRLEGEIVAPIQFEPMPAFFVSTFRGVPKEVALDVVNHEPDPLRILSVEHPTGRFTTRLETVEEGRHYRLTLSLSGEGPAGRRADTVTLVTSSRDHPFLEVPANTLVKERVYALPDSLDFGTIPVPQLKARPGAAQFLAQSLMVYQDGGTAFQVSAGTDIPFLRLAVRKGSLNDRFEISAEVIPEKLKSGSFQGSIVIATNDQEFPNLVIPVRAVVDGDWR